MKTDDEKLLTALGCHENNPGSGWWTLPEPYNCKEGSFEYCIQIRDKVSKPYEPYARVKCLGSYGKLWQMKNTLDEVLELIFDPLAIACAKQVVEQGGAK